MKRSIYCTAIFAVILYSCNRSNQTHAKNYDVQDQTMLAKDKQEEEPAQEKLFNTTDTVHENNSPAQSSPSITTNTDWDKKIIKTADLQLELKDYSKFNTSFHNSIKKFGAYIAVEKQQQTDYKLQNDVTIKVPVAQFDDLVNSLSSDDIKVIEKNISGEDVTTEVVDTKARLQAKLAVREKYLQLLKQARNMKEILEVQEEVNSIQEDIEAASGRINYLQHSAAYSTINASYYQYINGSSASNDEPNFFTKLSNAFSTGTSFLSNLVVFLISIWPFLLSIIIFWVFIKRFKIKKA